MKNNKTLFKAVSILINLAGFPALLIVAIVKSVEWNSYGMYGAGAFTPLFLVLALWAVVGGIQAAVYFTRIKKNKHGGMTLRIAAIPVITIIGLFGIVDCVMPKLLNDGTSGTILYEDVVEDYQGQHEKLAAIVEQFKEKNGLEDSVKADDDAFRKIFDPMFESMDKAYHAFDPLAIEIALDSPDLLAAIGNGKFPLELAATLMLKTADGNDNDHNLSIEEIISMNLGQIADAASILLEDGLDLSDTVKLNDAINALLVTKEFDGIEWNIFNILGSNMLAPDIDPNAAIVKNAGTQYEKKMGAAMGYQDMSWINGLNDMFFIPLMSIRETLYVFAAVLALLAVIQVGLAQTFGAKFKKAADGPETASAAADDNDEDFTVVTKDGAEEEDSFVLTEVGESNSASGDEPTETA